MITSIQIEQPFETYPYPFGYHKGYKISALPVGHSLNMDSYLVLILGDNGSGKSTFLNKLDAYCSNSLAPKYFSINSGSIMGQPKTNLFKLPKQDHSAGYFMSENSGDLSLAKLSTGQFVLHHIKQFLDESRKLKPEEVLLFDQPEDSIALKRRQALVELIRGYAFDNKRQIFVVTHEPRFLREGRADIINMDIHPATVCKARDFDLEGYMRTV